MFELPYEDGIALLQQAKEAVREERLHRQWCVQLPYMSKEDFTPFGKYIDQCTGRNIDTRPTADIIEELDAAEARLMAQKEGAS